MVPLNQADCVWFMDLPDTRKEYEEARRRVRPGTPFVLQVMETPAGRSQNFEPKNQALFDCLVTYQQQVERAENCYSYRLPHSLGGFHGEHSPFQHRKCLVMVNSNRVEGWLAPRQPGLAGLPGIGRNLVGWHVPLYSWFYPARGELYSWRRSFAREAECSAPQDLDIYGPSWHGERVSWLRIYGRRPYKCRVSDFTDKKHQIISNYRFCIAVENYRGKFDYISEKIFDPMIAGTVPVYLGDENITNVVPSDAFVDVRHFKGHTELLHYLNSCSESEWTKMFEAGRSFLKSETAKSFSTETYVDLMNRILFEVMSLQ
jgi:hypothetical protein